MKTIMKLLLPMVFVLVVACSSEVRPTNFDQLPPSAQKIILDHFNKEDILLVTIDRDGLQTEYEVRFKDGTEIEFDKKGNLKKIDCGRFRVPDALIPAAVLSYVQENFPTAFITEWGKDDRRWKAELNNGLELVFDNNYKFVGFDD